MRFTRLVSLTVIAVCVLTGCTTTVSRHLIARPSLVSMDVTKESPLPEPFKGRVISTCTKAAKSADDPNGCIYRTVFYDDSATFAQVDKPQRNALAYFLLKIANDNCSAWMTRVYANRSTLDAFRDTTKNLMTGAAALAAVPAPGISAGLGFANLFADSTVRSIDANAYSNQTFDAFRSAVNKERNQKQGNILERLGQTVDEYPVGALILDITEYKDMCTLTAGLESLQKITSTAETSSEKVEDGKAQKLFGLPAAAPQAQIGSSQSGTGAPPL